MNDETADKDEGMEPEALHAALSADIEDAATFIDTEIAPYRALATRFYHAEPFGDEEEGRSQFVLPLVRDTARATLPSLVRIFCGSQRVVEFESGAVGKERFAEDATNTVNYVLMRQNPGFSILWSAFKDALVRKTGWIKWWWDDSIKVSTTVFSGVTEQQLEAAHAALERGEELKVIEKIQVGEREEQVGVAPAVVPHPETGEPVQVMQPVMGMVPVYEYKIHIVKRYPCNQVRVAAVPPEELIVSRDSVDEDNARLVAHRTLLTRSELVAMGVSEEDLEDVAFEDITLEANEERLARQPGAYQHVASMSAAPTKDQQKVLFYDCWYLIDHDGDGISELRHIWAIGRNKKIVRNEPIDEVPVALLCPDPEPHTMIGLSQADSVMDLQTVTSHIWRDMLDSLKASIFPRMAYVEGQANADDVLNTEIGAAIRMRQPGMVAAIDVPFVGDKAYSMLDRLESVREQRTGISQSSIGLDPSALQSTNQIAVTAAVTSAQAQVELIARIFAETGIARLFKGILKLLTRHQDQAMQFRLNGRDFEVNPADWDPNMDLIVHTGLGTGLSSEKIAVLESVSQKQVTAMERLGLDNPLCSLQEFYNTQRKILQLAGFSDTHRYFRDPELAMAQGKEIQPPGPSPEQVLAEAQVEIERAKAEAQSFKVILDDDRERDKMEIEAMLKLAEIKARYNQAVDVAELKAFMDERRATMANRTREVAAR